MFFSKRKDNRLWKLEYFDTVYKIYDWDKKLTGYFFPNYDEFYQENTEKLNNSTYNYDEETDYIEKLHKQNKKVYGGNLMLPMIKLNLLDEQEGIDLDYAISSLEENILRAKEWKRWIKENNTEFNVAGVSLFTSREDRNMLSIVIGLSIYITLGEKELLKILEPLLNRLHGDGMI